MARPRSPLIIFQNQSKRFRRGKTRFSRITSAEVPTFTNTQPGMALRKMVPRIQLGHGHHQLALIKQWQGARQVTEELNCSSGDDLGALRRIKQ